jgi:cardiolipin synthase
MHTLYSVLSVLFVLNIILAFCVIFTERKNPSSTWAWFMVLLLIPSFGFILYLLFGQNLSKKRIFKYKIEEDYDFHNSLVGQMSHLKKNKIRFNDKTVSDYKDMIHMHLINSNAIFTQDNEVEIFTDGNAKFNALIECIDQAEDHIHLLYYIVKNDSLGKKIVNALTKKAKEGVEVKFLYDAMGGRYLPKNFFKDLRNAGGQVAVFFPSKLKYINTRVNFRNHRKLAIIDGKYGFIGGFNIGDEYLGLNKKMGYWRDTHLKIYGSAVYMLQARFILDWCHASKEDFKYEPKDFPIINSSGKTGIQIVSCGPDSEQQQIKNGYLKMINSAKETIYIQTPYFVPDESVLDALRIAALSGVDVRIMIPNKPDHPFVYWASSSYIGELLTAGVKTYTYEPGFLHAKTIVIDGKIASVGTANIDVRSFKLNFEVNAFIYDTQISRELKNVFEKDIKCCKEITEEIYKERSRKIRFKESISRLLSPIL